MELWIRSQDKKYLIKVNKKICIMDYDDDFFKAIRVDDLQVGSYETKEKALEVLDEIQKLLKPTIITTGYECECKDNPLDKMSFNLEMMPTKTEIKELSCIVYEMPQE